MQEIDARFHDGIFLGLKEDSDEILISTESGIFISRAMRRQTREHRWSPTAIKAITGTPWKPYGHTTADTLRTSLPAAVEPAQPGPGPTPSLTPDPSADIAPRRLRIERRDLERLGYSPGCPGCYSAKHRRPHKPHTETCRKNILTKMRSIPDYADRIAASENRENRYLEKMLQQQFGDAPDAGPSTSPSASSGSPGNTETANTNKESEKDIKMIEIK